MRAIIFFLTIVFLSACQSFNNNNKKSEFYTWIDERGQLHTEKRKTTVSVDSTEGGEVKKNTVIKNSASINKDIYTSSEEIDNKLNGKRLYSWQDSGYQSNLELSNESHRSTIQSPKNEVQLNEYIGNLNALKYREGKEVLLSEQINKSLNLSQLYLKNKKTNLDYILLDINIKADYLEFRSYIKKEKASLPVITYLDVRYRLINEPLSPFEFLVKETWASYGYLQGVTRIPKRAVYLLIQTNLETGVIEAGDTSIVLSDLGSLLLKPINP